MNLIYAFVLMKLNAWTAEIIASFHGLFCGVTRPWETMSLLSKDTDSAFEGAGSKAYPYKQFYFDICL
jgi:hypothetical protein